VSGERNPEESVFVGRRDVTLVNAAATHFCVFGSFYQDRLLKMKVFG
jgi:hypothetical protein